MKRGSGKASSNGKASAVGRRRGILVGGNFIIDRVKVIEKFPEQDALTSIASETLANGGCAYNVLTDLAHLTRRIPLEAVGRVGSDDAGRHIREDCKRLGIAIEQLRASERARTSFTDVMSVKGNGRRTFFHYRGANALLSKADFDFSRSGAKIFHLGYLLLLDALDQPDKTHGTLAGAVLERAARAGMITVVDVVSEDSDRYRSVVLPTLPHVDYLLCNELEAERTTGSKIRSKSGSLSRERLERAASKLLAAGVRRAVILHLAEGALWAGRDGALSWQGSVKLPARSIAGTTGAGDAFAAGLLYALHEERTAAEALELAACVAAASLRDPSPSRGVGALQSCVKLGRQYGYRP